MIGSRVLGLWSNGCWYPGEVTQQRERHGTTQYFVQFDDGDTAWLALEQLQVKSAPSAAARTLAPFPGARVEGEWSDDSWYPGYVAEARADGGTFFVQFDDGDTSWLPPSKIRPGVDRPNAAPAPELAVGTRVKGEWSEDSWYPGVVARSNPNATMFFIQFDDGDQKWLPARQLRYAPSARAPSPAGYGQAPPAAAPAAPQLAWTTPTAAVERPAPEVRCAYCKTRIVRNDQSHCAECGAKV